MSLVIAAISKRSRSRLHSASISAVLPEPTGPPTPTRRGPCAWHALMTEQPRVLRLVAHAGEVGAERRAADVVERRGERARRGRRDDRLERGEHALPVGLAERNEPHAGGDQIGGHGVQIGVQRRLERDAVAGAATPTATG